MAMLLHHVQGMPDNFSRHPLIASAPAWAPKFVRSAMKALLAGSVCRLLAVSLVMSATSLWSAPIPGIPDGCATRCHRSKARDGVVHGPVASDDCIACHNPVGAAVHPKQQGAFRPVAKGAALCQTCHESMASKRVVHPPVGGGECLSCHDPHQSANPSLLKARGAALCFGCHDAAAFSVRHGHLPVTTGECLKCHDPHQSDSPRLLRGSGAALCFRCHDEKMAAGRSIHQPVARGECCDCHNPHGSSFPKLLRNAYPEALYLSYEQNDFALCFTCHSRQMADDRRTDTLTGFRNGDNNLHYLHINKPDKGRSCKTCHDAHAAPQQRLVKERIPGFGSWDIPIRYTKTDTGGTCVVGCHKPKSYDRLRAVSNP